MIINHNLNAINAHRFMGINSEKSGKAMEKLASGLRINRAGDDAAGLAISEKMRGQIRGLDQASRNAQDAISMLQTAEGSLGETHSILQRMRELAVQAGNDTNTSTDRDEIQKEINQLTSEINKIGNTTEFNTKKLLTGTMPQNVIDNVIKGLKEGWLELAEERIQSAYGLAGQGTHNLKIVLDGGQAYGELAHVGGTSSTIELHIDMTDFAEGDWENGSNNLGKGFYDDRIIAHEMTHAVMADALGTTRYNNLATWFKEGTAEFIPGADERLKDVIGNTGNTAIDVSKLSDLISHTNDLLTGVVSWSGSDEDYAGAYVAVKFLVNKLGTADFKTLMGELDTKTLGQAIVDNSSSAYGSFNDFASDFQSNGTAYVNSLALNFGSDETDTGSIAGSNHGGAALSAEAVINESDADDKSDGQPLQKFTVIWPDTTSNSEMNIQVGANQSQQFKISINDIRARALGITAAMGTSGYTGSNTVTDGIGNSTSEAALDISTASNATSAVAKLQTAIEKVSSERSKLGAYQNRLEHTINNLQTASQNLAESESRIRDVDMAKAMMDFSKNNILTQAAQAMLAQANQQPQGILQLLR